MRRLSRRWVTGAIALSLAGAFGAHATIASRDQVGTPAPILSDGYDAAAHFPGAALEMAVADNAAPAPGTTGTMPLPDLPVPSDALLTASAGIAAAQPFRLRGSGIDQSRALQCLTTAIYYEAASEPDAGQQAVAQVILNRVRHPAFPATVCGVVYQGSDKRGCQFSFACDGSMARVPVRRWWDRAQRVAAAALNGSVFAPVGLATHYHTYAVTPSWNRGLVMTDAEGAHFFHRWKGFWGTPAAFRDRYFGGEPMPGPLRPAAVPAMIAAAPALDPLPVTPAPSTPATATIAPVSVTPAQQVQAPYAESGTAVAARADESQVLDKWKDAGKPIR
ncbi:cell wall hydrolase [Sphingomonas spermidinifaciens]|uniref:Cell wall hydrolase n=2 Tax=Sphingomonas spermidinifaciens TaxID=1141889 RepID=A0A2A4B9I4_9SPHN|nr:cell wall hydrolase [Sphingomonas spermidinifaciens]